MQTATQPTNRRAARPPFDRRASLERELARCIARQVSGRITIEWDQQRPSPSLTYQRIAEEQIARAGRRAERAQWFLTRCDMTLAERIARDVIEQRRR